MGDGVWDFEQYWIANFCNGIAAGCEFPSSWSNNPADLPSRYDVYRYEIDQNLTQVRSQGTFQPNGTPNDDGEIGVPVCYSGGGVTDEPDRRLLFAAIVNCGANSASMNGRSTVPIEAFGRFFVTEPLENGGGQAEDNGDDSIRAELVDLIDGFGTGTSFQSFLRPEVQLYR